MTKIITVYFCLVKQVCVTIQTNFFFNFTAGLFLWPSSRKAQNTNQLSEKLTWLETQTGSNFCYFIFPRGFTIH